MAATADAAARATAPGAAAGAGAPAVSIRGLSFRVAARGGGHTPILSGIDLTLAAGEFVAIVGPSGCGKSTLLNFIAGLLPVKTGSVSVLGGPPGAAGVGYMFQTHALLPWRTVLRNVELGLEVAGMDRAERRRRATHMLAQVGLEGHALHFPAELSGGMRQRAALARTLVADPALLLMDEPFGALDAQTKLNAHALFLRTWEAASATERKSVLLVTHDLAEAIALADRVLVMGARPGRVVAEYAVELPRPRDVQRLHNLPRFNLLLDRIWDHLRQEPPDGPDAGEEPA
ncbi:ABC transporter ATP-binding protein [Xanthobacter sp. V4C-4]|uniref:ABC transporter ATP-binding protein n=1 Tax=Xanthobacter cornucopiae TaxID=3119924 RepID=UPI00372C0764